MIIRIIKSTIYFGLIICGGSVAMALDFFDTGVDGNHQQLSGGAQDPHYQMRQVTAGSYTGNANWSPAIIMQSAIDWSSWVQPADARWIYLANAANLGQDWGTYEYMTTFDLTGYDPSTAVLQGNWAVDQYGDVYLNGNHVAYLPDGNWNSQLNAFKLTSGFVPGVNTLTFYVRHPDGGDGMIVSGATVTATPVPALGITLGASQVMLYWTNSISGYAVLSTTNLASGNWITNTGATTINGTNFLSVPSQTGTMFFRLGH